MSFTFNRNYKDLEQVAPFFDAFTAVYEELAAAGQYPYNDSFKGRIPGIEGESEDSAIYLLQQQRALNELQVQIDAAKADGCVEIDPAELTEEPRRFARVVEYGWYVGGTGYKEWTDARLLLAHGTSVAVLPKGRRTRGHLVSGKLLAKAA